MCVWEGISALSQSLDSVFIRFYLKKFLFSHQRSGVSLSIALVCEKKVCCISKHSSFYFFFSFAPPKGTIPSGTTCRLSICCSKILWPHLRIKKLLGTLCLHNKKKTLNDQTITFMCLRALPLCVSYSSQFWRREFYPFVWTLVTIGLLRYYGSEMSANVLMMCC